MSSIGVNIRRAIRSAGLTQAALASALKVSPGAVGNWVHGYNPPTVRHLRRIAEKCNTTVAALLGEPS